MSEFFYNQNSAFEYADKNKYDLIISRKNEKGTFDFSAINSNDYKKFIKNVINKNKETQFNTIIREGQNDQMRLDIEIYLKKKELSNKAEELIEELIEDISDYEKIDMNYYESDNSRVNTNNSMKEYNYKFSKHIFFNHYFETGEHQLEFWNKFLLKYQNYEKISNKRLHFNFDMSVYNKNSQWNETKRTSEKDYIERCPTIIDYKKCKKINVEISNTIINEVKHKPEHKPEQNKNLKFSGNVIFNNTQYINTEIFKKCLQCLSFDRIDNHDTYCKFVWCSRSLIGTEEGYKLTMEKCKESNKFNIDNFNKKWNDGKYNYSKKCLFEWAEKDNSELFKKNFADVYICNFGLYSLDDIYYIIIAGNEEETTKKLKEYLVYNYITLEENTKTIFYLDDDNIWRETIGTATYKNKLYNFFKDILNFYIYRTENILKEKINNYEEIYEIGKGMIKEKEKKYKKKTKTENEIENDKKINELQPEIKKQLLNFISIKEKKMEIQNLFCKESHRFIASSLTYITRHEKSYSDIFNTDKDILSVNNGIIELKTMTLRERERDDMVTYACPVDYKPEEGYNFIEEKIKDAFSYDENGKIMLQNYLGYSVTGHTSENKFLICYGEGSNMKSVIDKLNNRIFGDKVYHQINKEALKSKELNNDALYNMKSARFISVNETEDDDKFNWSLLKGLTGGDKVNIAAKFRNAISFYHNACLIFFTNSKPVLPVDAKFAERRRPIFLPFKKQFLDKSNIIDMMEYSDKKEKEGLIGVKDRHLEDKLLNYSSQYLNWILKGTSNFYKNDKKLIIPDSIQSHILEEIENQDIIKNFIKENCVDDSDFFIPSDDLYNKFLIDEGKSKNDITKAAFSRKLKNLGYETKPKTHNGAKKRVYMGLRFIDDDEGEDEDNNNNECFIDDD